jgi:hypothetical protein
MSATKTLVSTSSIGYSKEAPISCLVAATRPAASTDKVKLAL